MSELQREDFYIHSEDPAFPVDNMKTLEDYYDEQLRQKLMAYNAGDASFAIGLRAESKAPTFDIHGSDTGRIYYNVDRDTMYQTDKDGKEVELSVDSCIALNQKISSLRATLAMKDRYIKRLQSTGTRRNELIYELKDKIERLEWAAHNET